MENNDNFLISQEDWSLHRKGHDDQQRHQEKVNEAIKNNLSDLVADESIILPEKFGGGIIKIPIKSLDEYKIRYNYDKMQHAGMGKGEVGDTVAQGQDKGENQSGSGPGKAGDKPGEDYYEAEIALMEVEKLLFEELELPNMEKKQAGIMEAESYEFNDIRRIGITGNIDKKKTMMAAFKRNAMNGESSFHPILQEDLRYKAWNEVMKPDTRAVIIAMMDTSGSMGIWEKYMARSMYFWIKRFLETKYESVEIVYIAHHTEANEVTEHQFFHKGESGGTICSSAYKKALQLIDTRYPPSQYNIFTFHASDGDNLTSDNKRCIDLIEKLSEKVNMFGYIEVNQYSRNSTIMNAYKYIKNNKYKDYVIRHKNDVFHALKHFFRREELKNEKSKYEYKSTKSSEEKNGFSFDDFFKPIRGKSSN